ncbi:MAG: hypothetical protein ACRBCK_10440 [Alphaproteobacteria bacterium]
MALVAGASQFLNQATLANTQGVSAQTTNVLGEAAGGVGILDVGRNLATPGVGISNSARALNRQFLTQNAGTANQLFSASGGGSATEEAAITQIRALQSQTPVTRATPEAREAADARAVEAAQAESADAERGSIIDQEA